MKKKINKDIETEEYEIGYRKPPKNGRFKKGISGNPLGRPKKQSDLGSGLMRELNSKVIINENGKRKAIKMFEAVLKQLVNKAASGSIQSQRLLLNFWQQAQESAAAQQQKRGHECLTPQDLTDEELLSIITADHKKSKQ